MFAWFLCLVCSIIGLYYQFAFLISLGVAKVIENDNLVGFLNDRECFSIKIK